MVSEKENAEGSSRRQWAVVSEKENAEGSGRRQWQKAVAESSGRRQSSFLSQFRYFTCVNADSLSRLFGKGSISSSCFG